MRALFRLVALVIATVVVFGGCNLMQGGPGTLRNHARARILIKEVKGVCTVRTVPKSHPVLKNEETEIVWDIKVKDRCFDGYDFVLKWKAAGRNPTRCTEIASTDIGNSRQRLKCDLASEVADDNYFYSVWIRKTGEADRMLEDPDVEIITF